MITIVEDPLFVCVSEFQCRTFSVVDIVGTVSGMIIVENNFTGKTHLSHVMDAIEDQPHRVGYPRDARFAC